MRSLSVDSSLFTWTVNGGGFRSGLCYGQSLVSGTIVALQFSVVESSDTPLAKLKLEQCSWKC